jgi:hypothetical protein
MSTPNHTNLCVQSAGSEDDWKDLYEASFPLDERMSVTEVRTLLANGTMLLHKTTDAQGGLQCFSLVTVLSNFILLAYIATDQTKRSSGVGSKHMKALIALLQKTYPTYLGLFLEIESTKEKNLSTDEDKARKRRLAFYQRLHCKRLTGREYLLPSYAPGTAARQGELLWFEFNGPVSDCAVIQAVIAEIYTKAYSIPTTDPAYIKVVGQFDATAQVTSSSASSNASSNASGNASGNASSTSGTTDTVCTPATAPSTTPTPTPTPNPVAPAPVTAPAPEPAVVPVQEPTKDGDSSPKS